MARIPFLAETVPLWIQAIGLLVFVLIGNFLVTTFIAQRPWPHLPLIKLPGKSAKASWLYSGPETIIKGIRDTNDGVFQVMSGFGPKVVLPNRFADEIKTNTDLSFEEALKLDFFDGYPGFEPFTEFFRHPEFMAEVIRTKLTQSLGLITNDLLHETADSIDDTLGFDREWHPVVFKGQAQQIVTRVSSRVFLGLPLCRDERWLRIAKQYTIQSFGTAYKMRTMPSMLRPVLHWIHPACVSLRKLVSDAHLLINNEVNAREKRAQGLIAVGKKPPKTADTIGWMVEVADQKGFVVKLTELQLNLTVVAIHTTSSALSRAIIDLCRHPEVVQPMREEIIEVIGSEGWSKTSLYKLRLMDSFLKESSRCVPQSHISLIRRAKRSVMLSDGTVLPAGVRLIVQGQLAAAITGDSVFDAWRYKKLREQQEGKGNAYQHVTPSSDHLGFGLGPHACPGRFFASNELKIVLAHLLLKFDMKLTNDGAGSLGDGVIQETFEGSAMVGADSKVLMRRRQEEINLDVAAEECLQTEEAASKGRSMKQGVAA